MYIDFEELAIRVGYSYLNAGEGYWEDGAGKNIVMIQWTMII